MADKSKRERKGGRLLVPAPCYFTQNTKDKDKTITRQDREEERPSPWGRVLVPALLLFTGIKKQNTQYKYKDKDNKKRQRARERGREAPCSRLATLHRGPIPTNVQLAIAAKKVLRGENIHLHTICKLPYLPSIWKISEEALIFPFICIKL